MKVRALVRYNQKESPVKGLNYGFFTLRFFKFRAFRTLHLPKRHVFGVFSREKSISFLKQGTGFFYEGFLPQTLTIHRTAGEGWGTSFIPL